MDFITLTYYTQRIDEKDHFSGDFAKQNSPMVYFGYWFNIFSISIIF